MLKKLISNVFATFVCVVVGWILSLLSNANIYQGFFVAELIIQLIGIIAYNSSSTYAIEWEAKYRFSFPNITIYSVIVGIGGAYILATIFHMDFFVMNMICSCAQALTIDLDRP